MHDIPMAAKVFAYVVMGFMGLFCILLAWWQLQVFKGKAMKSPDGSVDDWHEDRMCYGIAVADLVIAVPVCLVGVVLAFLGFKVGYYLFALVSFWSLWANIMTTATSLRFSKPKINIVWFFTFPFGSIVGLAYIAWSVVYFDNIY